ncbi:1-(5-phosphoribosyl)-5-[(5-phosphoribosylamino)methylideneamino] imidazole-4-carboxamide isomerase [Buchnera aphidicola]|uniref:1-(5-phosphoribosyl)-5-[(5- phosphoribosylamino)methylideneamino] imidazole-4-carboxamide isomerase n=1 Tax=Buchnera aphidicola TaxID=9 RepID=UPI003464BBCD
MIIPSIDIINNKIVRLYQGDYGLVKYYHDDIYNILSKYIFYGSKVIHIVDLDSARSSEKKRSKIFYKIINTFKNFIQIAGGICTEKEIEYFLSIGAKRIVIGSAVINNIKKVKNWIQYYGNDYIVAALDIRITEKNIKNVCIHGWETKTNIQLEDVLYDLSSVNIKHVLCTDISRDGTLMGPNLDLYQDLVAQFPSIHFQSSGGICQLSDIEKLKKIGVRDIIIGKSLLEKKFTILEAVQCWQKGSFLASM